MAYSPKQRREYQARYRAKQKRKTGTAQKNYGDVWDKRHPAAEKAHNRQEAKVKRGEFPKVGRGGKTVAHHDKGYKSTSTRRISRIANAKAKHGGKK